MLNVNLNIHYFSWHCEAHTPIPHSAADYAITRADVLHLSTNYCCRCCCTNAEEKREFSKYITNAEGKKKKKRNFFFKEDKSVWNFNIYRYRKDFLDFFFSGGSKDDMQMSINKSLVCEFSRIMNQIIQKGSVPLHNTC